MVIVNKTNWKSKTVNKGGERSLHSHQGLVQQEDKPVINGHALNAGALNIRHRDNLHYSNCIKLQKSHFHQWIDHPNLPPKISKHLC